MLKRSDFIQQSKTISKFSSNNSWALLSTIENEIKDKIEKIGTPLKDWDIQINYGIKTGFNEAFIIDGVKRKELIDQHSKSEEIIRPYNLQRFSALPYQAKPISDFSNAKMAWSTITASVKMMIEKDLDPGKIEIIGRDLEEIYERQVKGKLDNNSI